MILRISKWKELALFMGMAILMTTGCTTIFQGGSRTFYVNSREGADSNLGTSPKNAWQSLKKVNLAKLLPGDTVRFKCGSVWRGSLHPRSGENALPVTYTSYGQGEKPLLMGSTERNSLKDWKPVAPNLWVTSELNFSDLDVVMDYRRSSEWSLHQEKDAQVSFMSQEDDKGVVCHFECHNSGDKSNSVQLWGSFPEWEALGDAELVTLRFQARSTKPFTIPGVAIRKGGRPWSTYSNGVGSLKVGVGWHDFAVRFYIMHQGESPRIHFNLGGDLPDDAVFEFRPLELTRSVNDQAIPLMVDVGNIIFDHGRECGWKKWNVEELKKQLDYYYDSEKWRVFLYSEKNPATVYTSIELALKRNVVNQEGAHHVVYDGLQIRNGAAHGFGGSNTHHLIIRNCDISYIGGGHQFTSKVCHPVRYGNGIEFWGATHDNLVEGCRLWEIYDAALTNQGKGATSKQINITYRNNLIWNSEYSFEYWNNPETAETRNLRFTNNTCVDAGVVWSHAQRPDRNGSHLMLYSNTAQTSGVEIKYNIFCNSTEWGSRLDRGWKPLPDMDYNLWHESNGMITRFFGKKIPANAVKQYLRGTGFDAHSVFVDPGFIDPEKRNYHLRPDSPARKIRPDGRPIGVIDLYN